MDRLGHDSRSSLEVNKPSPPTDVFSRVTTTLSSDRQPVSALPDATSSPNARDNGSKAKSKKRAIEHDEADTRVIEATSYATSSGLLLLSDTAERQAVDTATPTTAGQSSDCVRTVAETCPMPDLFGQDDDGDT